MKYIHALTMLCILVATFILIQLGASWLNEGYGLHPYICAIGVVVLLALGWKSSTCLATLEEQHG